MNFFRRRKILKDANYLELTPVHAKEYSVDSENKVTVIIPKFTNKFMVDNIIPKIKHPDIKINLDELGSSAWLAIDGKTKVKDIAIELHKKFGDKIHPVDERLTKFLTQLYEQSLITFDEIKGV